MASPFLAAGAGQGGGSLQSGGAGDAQPVLNDADGLDDFIEGNIPHRLVGHLDGIPQYSGFIDQPGHLGLGAAVPQLQVIQHGVVVLGKTLVGVLDGTDAGAHFVGVVGHLDDGLICHFGGGLGVAAQALQQRGRKAGDLLHIAVGRYAGGGVGLLCIGNDLAGTVFEKRFHAAQALLQSCAFGQCLAQGCADARGCDDALDGAHQLAAEAFSRTGSGGIAAQCLGNAVSDPLG